MERRAMHYLFFPIIFLVIAVPRSFAQSETVFSGLPSIKISEGGTGRVIEDLPRDKALNLGCVISKIGGKYYWASRENKEMTRIQSGAFETFIAVNGSGYVRVIQPKMKSFASLMAETEDKFDYVEHMLIGLKSVTYYGISEYRTR